MQLIHRCSICLIALIAVLSAFVSPGFAQTQKLNILVVMGDDVGWFNVGAYHQGVMSGKTPNLDRPQAAGSLVARSS